MTDTEPQKVFLVYLRIPGTVVETYYDHNGFDLGYMVDFTLDEGVLSRDLFRCDETDEFNPDLWED